VSINARGHGEVCESSVVACRGRSLSAQIRRSWTVTFIRSSMRASIKFLPARAFTLADLAHAGAVGSFVRGQKSHAASASPLIASLKAREASWYASTNYKMPASGRPGGALGGAECRAGSLTQRLRPHPISNRASGLLWITSLAKAPPACHKDNGKFRCDSGVPVPRLLIAVHRLAAIPRQRLGPGGACATTLRFLIEFDCLLALALG
jgi:hypothetical protein